MSATVPANDERSEPDMIVTEDDIGKHSDEGPQPGINNTQEIIIDRLLTFSQITSLI